MNRLLLSFAALIAASAAACAHAQLEIASPPVGGAVEPPAQISLTFSEGVEPKFSGVAVSGPGGVVPVGKASVAPGTNKVLVVKIGKTLAPGSYTVKWHAVSVDSHHTQGTFDFTVK